MQSVVRGWFVAAAVTSAAFVVAAPVNDLDTVDLSSLDEIVSPRQKETVWDAVPYESAGLNDGNETRFYLTGMLGSSFATLDDPLYGSVNEGASINRTLLTAGGAAGMAYARENGQLRVEFEGRGRDDLTRHIQPNPIVNFDWSAADGWSAMVNIWRDFAIDERWLVYAGGGIGAGGYRYNFDGNILFVNLNSSVQVATFAWQAGGGVVYNITERMAFDVGYRFFALEQSDSTGTIRVFDNPAGRFPLQQQFVASELLFGLRIYEPFRTWR
ncbi:MAG: outer membrane beta-barrel protein [Planctomycetia bacterium]|nr:outer membrane beta-barrel protein [Planctomycetia bacterium]